MKKSSETQFIRVWELSFLLLTALMLSSVWAFASHGPATSLDGQRTLSFTVPILAGIENPAHWNELTELAYLHCTERIDKDSRLSLHQQNRLHGVLAVLEYQKGNIKAARQHYEAHLATASPRAQYNTSLFTLAALLKAEEAKATLNQNEEILLKQAFYTQLNRMDPKEAHAFVQQRLQQWNTISAYAHTSLLISEEMLGKAQEYKMAEDVLIDLISAVCCKELQLQYREVEMEVLSTWLYIHAS